MPEPVTLRVKGRRYGGWKAVRVIRSIEQMSGAFEVTLSEKHPSRPSARELRPGDAVVVELGSDPVITGYIDDVSGKTSKDGIEVTVAGRDRAADLVDCAPDLDPSEWNGLTLDGLARKIAEPFGIEVVVEVDVAGSFPKIVMNPGQQAWTLLEERARYRQALLVSDGRGRLVITRAGAGGRAEPLVEGANVLSADWAYTQRDRFSEYVIRGQSPGSDSWSGDVAAGPVGRALDASLGRYRPFVQVVSSALDVAKATARAQWESTVRAGRAQRLGAGVLGWRQRSGALWAPNQLAHFQSASAGVRAELLIASVEYGLDAETEEGTTKLSLLPPSAFAVEPPDFEKTKLGFQGFQL